MAEPAIAVVELAPSEIEEAADLLTRAFFDYPVWTWMAPDEVHRREVMPFYMRMSLLYGMRGGIVHTTAGATRGIAIWEPPHRTDADYDDAEANALWEALPQRLGEDGIAKHRAMIAMQAPIRERLRAGGPAWYATWVGVEPDVQRSGIGSALLNHAFAMADASSVPVMLETEKQANVPYYERHGFRVVASGDLPLDGPGFWTMLRKPPST